MPSMERFKTDYVGVYYVMGTSITTGKPEKIFYIQYRRNGKLVEEKAGRAGQDNMTASKASQKRAEKITGKQLTNEERRQKEAEEKAKKKATWTIEKLWNSYKENNPIKGIKTDQNRFDLHIKPVLGHKEPKEIAPLDVDRLRLKMAKEHKPATVKNTLELLRRIINYGVNKNLIPPVSFKVKLPKVDNLKTEDLTQDEIRALMKAIDESIHPLAGPLMKMALFTGMRRGELFNLRWSDIDEERGFITIQNPKGGISQKIPLNDEARQVLENLSRESEFIFYGRGGDRRVDIHRAVNEIKTKAGLPKDFRALHGLRHVYASMLASSGQVDMLALQKLLTHKSPQMVLRYAHLRDSALKAASNLAGQLVNQAIQEQEEPQALKAVK